MGSHSYLMNLSCNNHSHGDIVIQSGGNDGEIINGSSNGCTGGNYHNSSSARSGGGRHHRHMQELSGVVFTGKLTNEPSLLNGHPASDLNGVRIKPVRMYMMI